MKFFIAIVLLSAHCASTIALESVAAESVKYTTQCMEVNKAVKKDFEDYGAEKMKAAEVPDTMKCMMKCFMEKMGYFDAGTVDFNAKVFLAKLGTVAKMDELQKAVTACKDLKGANPCDTGFAVMACMWKNKVMQGSWSFLTGKATF